MYVNYVYYINIIYINKYMESVVFTNDNNVKFSLINHPFS